MPSVQLDEGMEWPKMLKVIEVLCRWAYDDGRIHQLDHDFPDVGLCFEKHFEDTKVFKILTKDRL